jgi:nucleoside-diphosphate-sugar epimerase
MRILITGATGFVGKYCVKTLSSSYQIIQLKRKGKEDEGCLIMDLTDIKSMKKLKSTKIDILVHLASAVPARHSFFFDTNVVGTYNLLRNLNKKYLKKIILLSSVSVYKNELDKISYFQEKNSKIPEDEYGKSKLTQELLIKSYCQDSIDYLIFRASSIYGPGNTSETLLPIWYEKATKNKDLVIQTKNYKQNFIHVKDVVEIIRQGIEKKKNGTYNLFSNDTIKIEELAKIIINVVNSSSNRGY